MKSRVDEIYSSKPASRIETFKRLLRFSWPEATRLGLGFSALIVNSITNLSFPYILGRAVDRASDGDDYRYFMVTTAGIFLAGSAASWIRVYCMGTAGDRISSRLRNRLFESCVSKEIDFFDSSQKGELLSVLDQDVGRAVATITENIPAGIRSMNSSFNGSMLLFGTSPLLFSITFSVVPIIGVGAMTLSKYSRKLSGILRDVQRKVVSFALERFTNISTVRLNGMEDVEVAAFADSLDQCSALSGSAQAAQGAFMFFINGSTNLSLMIVLFMGGGLIKEGRMTTGTLTKFAVQSAFVGLGFSGLSAFYSDLMKSLDAAERVFFLMDKDNSPTLVCKGEDDLGVHADLDLSARRDVECYDEKKGIELNNIHFSYKSRLDACILRGLSLNIPASGLTVVTGRSGVGKSSLLALITGLRRPLSGQISIGGVMVDDFTAKWIRQRVGVVTQLPGLMSGTIRSNIAYGKRGATEKEIMEAAVAADAHEFISKLPEGYGTQVGESGGLLSGGQLARIALARAVVRDPSYVLLDEVTAALDAESEAGILETLKKLSLTKGVILFTHSEALLNAASKIYVVENGVASIPTRKSKFSI